MNSDSANIQLHAGSGIFYVLGSSSLFPFAALSFYFFPRTHTDNLAVVIDTKFHKTSHSWICTVITLAHEPWLHSATSQMCCIKFMSCPIMRWPISKGFYICLFYWMWNEKEWMTLVSNGKSSLFYVSQPIFHVLFCLLFCLIVSWFWTQSIHLLCSSIVFRFSFPL